jgi:hypothetical protein
VHKLQWHDPSKRINFCKWILYSVYDGEINSPDFLLNEALFHVHCGAKSQNYRWNSYQLSAVYKFLLCDAEIGVWCKRKIGLFWGGGTVNRESYREYILFLCSQMEITGIHSSGKTLLLLIQQWHL